MPNRIIKDSICSSENLNTLSDGAERFFYRLIVNCDDFGRADARPKILRPKCFPLQLDRVSEDDIHCWMSELARADLIVIYEYDGKPYLEMITWLKHEKRRARYSKYPDPHADGSRIIACANTCEQVQTDANTCEQMQTDESTSEQMQTDADLIRDSKTRLEYENRDSKTRHEDETRKGDTVVVVRTDDNVAEVAKAYENNIGLIKEASSREIIELCSHYPRDWILEAINIAVFKNRRNLDYIHGILKNWEAEGKKDGKRCGNRNNVRGAPASSTQPVDWSNEPDQL